MQLYNSPKHDSLVRIALGEYMSTYEGNSWVVPIKHHPQGLGQGNGAYPYIWYILITYLLSYLREAGHGAAFKFCISCDTKRLVGYCLVDDSTIEQVTPPHPNTPAENTVKLV